jgi:putative ABC transport system permease protein
VSSGEINLATLVGFDPDGQLFTLWNITQGSTDSLKQPYSVIVDRTKLHDLNVQGVGDTASIGSLQARIVGLTRNSQSIVMSDFLFTSLEDANAFANSPSDNSLHCRMESGKVNCADIPEKSQSSAKATPAPRKLSSIDPISFILIRAKPGQDLEVLKQRLDSALPDTHAYTRAEIANRAHVYWQQRTGVGFILGLGAAVGVIVGMVIVSQILYSSVSDHLKEFGTLKAMGASDWNIYSVIIEQSLWMAILGYIPGMLLCIGVGYWTYTTQGIMILITPASAMAVFGITIVMCVGSALFAIQKVTRVDPAIVFKA